MTTAVRPAMLVAVGTVLAACTAVPAPPAGPVPAAEPPAPPLACLLDTAALDTATGLTWAPDTTTASDRRCVYDPAGGSGNAFVAVDVVPNPPEGIEIVAEACEAGTRTPAGTGFVCRLPAGGVLAAQADGDRMVTVAAAEMPSGTTAEQLSAAFAEQLG